MWLYYETIRLVNFIPTCCGQSVPAPPRPAPSLSPSLSLSLSSLYRSPLLTLHLSNLLFTYLTLSRFDPHSGSGQFLSYETIRLVNCIPTCGASAPPLSLSLSISLSLSLFISLYIYLSLSLSIYLPFIDPSLSLFLFLSLGLKLYD